jgi:16S rRNA (cytosine1402-N4)-methyltransferase
MDRPLPLHVPVMLDEVIQWLDPRPGQVFVDGTLGGGGHTAALARRVGDTGLVIALDRDGAALAAAEQRLAGLPVKLVAASYCELPEVLAQLDVEAVHGIVLDLGLSSDQLADVERGFSFDADGPLDLRFDVGSGEPAWRLIERLDAVELANLIFRYGEERHSRRIARRIVEERRAAPVRTARQLAQIVRASVPRGRGKDRIDSATRTFQALRIAVNDELGALEDGLKAFPDCLAPDGRVAVISFHSLEDRLVKETFRDDPRYEVLTRKPLRPTDEEVARNPRSRSAKMRVARRAATIQSE